MAKLRGYPDRRGMGAESDAISEQFVPSARYTAQQRVMAQTLLASGLTPDQIANMLFVPLDLPAEENAHAVAPTVARNEDPKTGE